ncbi:hypothetical protein ACSLVK_01080 [Photorhabdus tasmaniensis]|nr:hypothetical protein [Photorhabdus tasmaniensis]
MTEMIRKINKVLFNESDTDGWGTRDEKTGVKEDSIKKKGI